MRDYRAGLSASQPEGLWSGRYEDLCEQVLGSVREQRDTWGLTLFLRRGMVAWMRAWPQTPATEPHRGEVNRQQRQAGMHFSAQLRDEVVSVLVNMFLHNQQEVLA